MSPQARAAWPSRPATRPPRLPLGDSPEQDLLSLASDNQHHESAGPGSAGTRTHSSGPPAPWPPLRHGPCTAPGQEPRIAKENPLIFISLAWHLPTSYKEKLIGLVLFQVLEEECYHLLSRTYKWNVHLFLDGSHLVYKDTFEIKSCSNKM